MTDFVLAADALDWFNITEGIFWLGLGLITGWLYGKVPATYRTLALGATIILVTFGVSDFVQAIYGSFLVPGMEWLFIWKIIDVVGLCVIFVWYLYSRMRHT